MSENVKSVIFQNLWDYLFFIWFVTDASFGHTIISMIGQLVFVVYSLNKCVIPQKIKWSYLFSLYALFVFFCWYNIANGFALSNSTAKTMLNVVVRNMFFIIFLFQYLRQVNIENLKYIFFYGCVASSFFILLLNFQQTGSFQMRDVEDSINGNLQAINNAVAMGWFYCLGGKKLNVKEIIMCVFLFTFCVLAGTRKAMIVLSMIVLLYIVLNNPQKIFTNAFKLLIIIGVSFFLLFKVDFIYNIIGNRFEGLLGFIDGKEEVDASTETRGRFIELGFYYFLLNPINGYGIDCFRELKGAYDTYSHNNYVELLFGIGLPGTIVYYLLYFVSLIKGICKFLRYRNSYDAFGIALILACLFADYGMVSYFSRDTFFRIMLCYFLVSMSKNANKNIQRYGKE